MLTADQALKKYFRLPSFRPGQQAIIESVLGAENTLAILPTGSGKSLTYQLPAVLLPGSAVVISPLLSLIRDQIQKLNQQEISCCQIDSTLSPEERKRNLELIQSGDIKIIYTSPETLSKPEIYALLKTVSISVIAIDEVHCYSEWGHNFRPSYLLLPALIRKLKPHAILALTATATPQVCSSIRKAFAVKSCNQICLLTRRDNLRYTTIPSLDQEREIHLISTLSKANHLPAIVYVMKQEQCESIAKLLNTHGFIAKSYHAGMSPRSRKIVQDAFLADQAQVIVATIAFGMGIDKPNIRSVIHYHLPKSPENWIQESGRAGRDGILSQAYLLACGDDFTAIEHFIKARIITRETLHELVQHLTQQGAEITIEPYQEKIRFDVLSSTLEVILAKLETLRIIRYSHTSWRYAQLRPLRGHRLDLHNYPNNQRHALQSILQQKERYDLQDAKADFNLTAKKLASVLKEMHDSGECQVDFSGWQSHYKLKKILNSQATKELTDTLLHYHQEQLSHSESRLNQVIKIITSNTCIPAQLERWLGTKQSESPPCGTCSSCLAETIPTTLPTTKVQEISHQQQIKISELLKHKKKRLNTPQKLARFLCGIPTPYSRHFFLYQDSCFGILKNIPYEEVYAYAQVVVPQ